ncbi:NAD(P)-dependent oxidoreductase [Neobacillus cucumis]|uniref:NAD(P)-dependent oxidoreductase n=1 Tax=Neobacillus cucumis TaxID=1740721 RepID=UPI0019641C9B|nr:NAD(P)-dependent oxidoreductase [Neobacillus cucumis]MBM7651825.1 3-hydroxyisobutyrate dehydrogenase-like beta-hydroxyacid dehydrogenase [Neobacillus cucumis]
MDVKRIGFIGLGAMGLPMAKNLLKNGFELHIVAHRNRGPVEELKQAGATEESSAAEIVSKCEVLISILPEDREMEAVLLSEEVLQQLKPGQVLIEMTSGSPDMMKKVNAVYQEKGARVLDAPVSGGTIGAKKGTLTVMAGGDPELLEICRPVLNAMAENIYLVGAVGAGKAIKAINQMLAGIHMLASAEAIALAETLEIDKEVIKEVIGKSSGSSWMLLNKADTLSKRDYTPGFKLSLMKKDIQIAINESAENNLPLASFALNLFESAAIKDGELDFSAVGKTVLS